MPHAERHGQSATHITDAGLAQLTELQELRTLLLNGTQISDSGIEHLRRLARLRELWLADTQISDAGKARLRLALPNCVVH